MEKLIFRDLRSTAAALADELYNRISRGSGKINIAVSGGSTPAMLFRILAEKFGQIIRWKTVNFFWVDERCVHPENEESNFKMTKEELFDSISIPEQNIFRIKGENNPAGESLRYSQLIKEKVPLYNEIPQFDIILLGIGEDGHTASIFPDQMNLLSSPNTCETARHPVNGQVRITLTGRILNNAKLLYFLVCGRDKREIVGKIINKNGLYPASHIDNGRNPVFFYLDESAAELLPADL